MFHVYVEGVTGTAPDAVRALADAMSAHYGLPAAEIHSRLMTGRFRVKANVDRAMAESYARELEALGARVRIEPAQSTAAPANARPAAPAIRTSPAIVMKPGGPGRPGASATSSLPPQPSARPTLSALPPQPSARPTLSSLPPPLRSVPSSLPLVSPGPSSDGSSQLGALDRGELLSLGSLDDDGPRQGSFVPPDDALPASIGPAANARPRDLPVDLFAPPAETAEIAMVLADDELAHRAHKRMSTPPPMVVEPAPRRSAPSLPPATQSKLVPGSQVAPARPMSPMPPMPSAADPAASQRELPAPSGSMTGPWTPRQWIALPRVRFAAGVALAIVLGFVPAHVVAQLR